MLGVYWKPKQANSCQFMIKFMDEISNAEIPILVTKAYRTDRSNWEFTLVLQTYFIDLVYQKNWAPTIVVGGLVSQSTVKKRAKHSESISVWWKMKFQSEISVQSMLSSDNLLQKINKCLKNKAYSNGHTTTTIYHKLKTIYFFGDM